MTCSRKLFHFLYSSVDWNSIVQPPVSIFQNDDLTIFFSSSNGSYFEWRIHTTDLDSSSNIATNTANKGNSQVICLVQFFYKYRSWEVFCCSYFHDICHEPWNFTPNRELSLMLCMYEIKLIAGLCEPHTIWNNSKYWNRHALANSVDPDQMLQNAASDLGLHHLRLILLFLEILTGSQMELFKF